MESDLLTRMEEMKARSLSGGLSSSDKQFIIDNYERVTFKVFKGTSCSRCYSDAFIEMYTSFNKYGLRDMPNFKLLRGVVLRSASFSEIITNSNITDELAIKWLKDNPKRAGLFEILPENWETLITETEHQNNENAKTTTEKKSVKKAKKETTKKAE